MQFIGPLTLEQQRWADELQAMAAAAAVFEPAGDVLRRHRGRAEAQLRAGAVRFLTAEPSAWRHAGRAVAELRAVAWLAHTGWQGEQVSGSSGDRGAADRPPDWRRFGARGAD